MAITAFLYMPREQFKYYRERLFEIIAVHPSCRERHGYCCHRALFREVCLDKVIVLVYAVVKG
jgi:hypothetical protein